MSVITQGYRVCQTILNTFEEIEDLTVTISVLSEHLIKTNIKFGLQKNLVVDQRWCSSGKFNIFEVEANTIKVTSDRYVNKLKI